MTAVFWGSFALGRLAGIPISLRFTPTTMIFADLLGAILSVLALILFHDSALVLWFFTACYGFSVASLFPSAINYAEAHFVVSGRVLSCLVVSASLGEALVPLLMGLSFDSPTGPLGLLFITAGVAVGATLIFAVIVGCVAPKKVPTKEEAEKEAEAVAKATVERRAKRKRAKKRAADAQAAAAAAAAASVSPVSGAASANGHEVAASVLHEAHQLHQLEDEEQQHRQLHVEHEQHQHDVATGRYATLQLQDALESGGEEEEQEQLADVDLNLDIDDESHGASNNRDAALSSIAVEVPPRSLHLNGDGASPSPRSSPSSPSLSPSPSIYGDGMSLHSPIKATVSRKLTMEQGGGHDLPDL